MVQSLVSRVSPELYSNIQYLVVRLCCYQVASQWARALWRPLRWKLLEAWQWPNAKCTGRPPTLYLPLHAYC